MKKPNKKDFTHYGSERQYTKALEGYVKYIESENNLLKVSINLNNPIDAKIKTEFKIFANIVNGDILYSIFDDKLIIRRISSFEAFVATLKLLITKPNIG